ncbi:hypothetical protein MKX03_034122 [Papaver bracteatum]|nr:hypothetical protein MKX03_034122 [Papaver bracteatum]
MFINNKRQQERTCIIELVNEFQNATNEVVAHLANFAYDPFKFLFLYCVTEPNEKLVKFGVGGICNAFVDPTNAALISQYDGIPLVVQCLSNHVRNTVKYALGSLYYLCNPVNKEEILNPEVVEVIERYASAGAVSVSFINLIKAFLEKHKPGKT